MCWKISFVSLCGANHLLKQVMLTVKAFYNQIGNIPPVLEDFLDIEDSELLKILEQDWAVYWLFLFGCCIPRIAWDSDVQASAGFLWHFR